MKSKNKDVVIGLADPPGTKMYHYFQDGALRLAEKLGPGKTIVTVLCDSGSRYASKLWNPVFLRSKGLPVPPWLEAQPPRDISDVNGSDLSSVSFLPP